MNVMARIFSGNSRAARRLGRSWVVPALAEPLPPILAVPLPPILAVLLAPILAVPLPPILAVILVVGAGLPEAGLSEAWAAGKNEKKEWRLDDFTKTLPAGKTYGKWDLQKISPVFGSGEMTFYQFVHDSPKKHYIHLKSGDDNSFSVGLKKDFEVKDWPVLEWEWKVTTLPKGGDVRVKKKDDQAGSLCVIVNPGLFGFKSLCYIWENDGPKDSPLTSTKREESRYLILRTGKEDGTGKWYQERREILKDYIRVFGAAPQEKAIVGMQIDSDSTESSAEAFYRNITLRTR